MWRQIYNVICFSESNMPSFLSFLLFVQYKQYFETLYFEEKNKLVQDVSITG